MVWLILFSDVLATCDDIDDAGAGGVSRHQAHYCKYYILNYREL